MTPKKFEEAVNECYRRMYAEAEPAADWDTMEKYDRFFMNHYLSADRQKAIRNDIVKEFKIPKLDRIPFIFTITLGMSPTSTEKHVH